MAHKDLREESMSAYGAREIRGEIYAVENVR